MNDPVNVKWFCLFRPLWKSACISLTEFGLVFFQEVLEDHTIIFNLLSPVELQWHQESMCQKWIHQYNFAGVLYSLFHFLKLFYFQSFPHWCTSKCHCPGRNLKLNGQKKKFPTKRFVFSSCFALLQVQIRDRVPASLSCLLDRFTAVTVCLCLSVLKMAASYTLFERC